MSYVQISEPKISKFIFADTRMGFVWLLVRLYVGYEWIMAAWDKLHSPVWTGSHAGVAVKGFLNAALAKSTGTHPDVSGWYASFINDFALHHTVGFSYMVAYGELLVGAALILGLFTGIAAFAGTFMNLNYLLAGTVSANPILLLLQLFLILAWRVAGVIGGDRYLLAKLGTPWQPGTMFQSKS